VQLDDLPGERQPEPGATRAPCDDVASSVEALAQVVEVGRSDAGTVVAHGHSGVTGAVEGSGADKHLGLVGRVLGGVGHQVVDDALDEAGIGPNDQAVLHREGDVKGLTALSEFDVRPADEIEVQRVKRLLRESLS